MIRFLWVFDLVLSFGPFNHLFAIGMGTTGLMAVTVAMKRLENRVFKNKEIGTVKTHVTVKNIQMFGSNYKDQSLLWLGSRVV